MKQMDGTESPILMAARLKEIGSLISWCQNELSHFPDYSGEVKQLVSISNQIEGDRAYHQAIVDNRIEDIKFLQENRGR